MFSECDSEALGEKRHTVGYLVSGMLGESHCCPLKEALLRLLGSVTVYGQMGKAGFKSHHTWNDNGCGMDGLLLPLS